MTKLLVLCILVLMCGVARSHRGKTYPFNTDYCDYKLCQIYTTSGYVNNSHIACQYENEFQDGCPSNARIVPIEGTILQDQIIELHDNYRGQFARGELGFLPAAKMPMMKWSAELAYLAEYNVKHCKFWHDTCHKTSEFKFAGQNIAHYPKAGSFFDPEFVIANGTWMWFDEYKLTNQSNLDKYTNPNKVMFGHFTQMMQDKAQYIGCAMVEYSNFYYYTYFVCNYSYMNLSAIKVYVSGAPCSQCKTECINGLCSLDEVVSASPYSRFEENCN